MKSLTPIRRLTSWLVVASFLMPTLPQPALADPPGKYNPYCDTLPIEADSTLIDTFFKERNAEWQKTLNDLTKNTKDVHFKLLGLNKIDKDLELAFTAPRTFSNDLHVKWAGLCKAKLLVKKDVAKFLEDMKKNEEMETADMCQGSIEALKYMFKQMNQAIGKASLLTARHINGILVEAGTAAAQHRTGITRFVAKKNVMISDGWVKNEYYDQNKMPIWPEFDWVWGTRKLGPKGEHTARTFPYSQRQNRHPYEPGQDDGYYGNVLLRLKKETEYFKRMQDKSAEFTAKLNDLSARCEGGGVVETSSGTDDSTTTDDTNTDTETSDEVTGTETDDQETSTDTETVVDTDNDGIPDDEDPDANGNGIADAEENGEKPVQEEKSWMAKNKNLLIIGGAGAAAVGGLLYFKKQQDKKDNMAAWNLDAEARAIASAQNSQNSSGGSGSSSGGSTQVITDPPTNATPQNSKIVILGGIPAGAEMNSNITAVTVSVITQNGMPTQDSGTPITVSCASPSPCSITGTTTVNTSAGSATFSNLRFTQADKGVKLMFTAPGFSTTSSVNTFDVTDNASVAPRQ